MSEESGTTEDILIQDNLLKSLSPMQFMQTMLSAVRVRIKNNFVTYTTAWQTVYSIIWCVLLTFSCGVFQKHYYEAYFYNSTIMYITCFTGTIVPNVSYIALIFVNRFIQRDKNIRIYAMLQKVDRNLQLDKCNYYTDFHYRLNCFVLFLVIVGFLCGFTAHAISVLDKPAFTVIYGVGLLTIYLDIFLGLGMIYFLAVRARVFNKIIKDRINECRGNVEKNPKVRTLKKILLSFVVPKVHDCPKLSHEKWLECLQDLLKSYKTITELYNFSMFNMSLTVLLWTYIVIAAIVVGVRNDIYPLSAAITLGMWAVYYYVQLTVTAIINDWFIMEVKKMKLLCIRLISYNYDGQYQKVASKMIRAIHFDTPIFVVYGTFVFDRRLPLEIIGVITSNALVLVQFLIDL